MGNACSGKTDGKTQYVELAYSLLDLVKHALKMIVNVLGDKDRLALVVFSNTAVVELELTKMNVEGKKAAIEKIDALKKKSKTNIYDGIFKAISLIKSR